MSRQKARPVATAAATRDRWLAAALSLAAHLSILLALILTWKETPRSFEPAAVAVTLVEEPAPAPAPAPASPASPAPARSSSARPPPPRVVASPLPAPAAVAAHATDEAPATGASSGLSDAQLAGATSAGAGQPGGPCDMARRLQNALRKDPLVQAAVAQTRLGVGAVGRAIWVWNGDWVQSDGEDGKGLAAVREAIMWEIAFAPPACRAESVRGLVLFSLNDAPGRQTRLAVGEGQWRWSDLLTLHRSS